MNHQPIYSTKDNTQRVIAGPNGTWLFQRRTETQGTREHDPWETVYKPFDERDAAIKRLPQDHEHPLRFR